MKIYRHILFYRAGRIYSRISHLAWCDDAQGRYAFAYSLVRRYYFLWDFLFVFFKRNLALSTWICKIVQKFIHFIEC